MRWWVPPPFAGCLQSPPLRAGVAYWGGGLGKDTYLTGLGRWAHTLARGLSSLQFLFFLFPAATIKDSFLLWRNDLEQSREPGVLGQEAGLRVGVEGGMH